jgi:hypothetical protein
LGTIHICQLRTTEPLTCPANKTRSAEGYKTLLSDPENFQSAGLLPSEIAFDYLSKGSLVETLQNILRSSIKIAVQDLQVIN